MGAQMVREVASKTNDKAGDGTTTATVLAQAIVREGSKAVAAGMNPMDLKRGVDMAVEAVVGDLRGRSVKIKTSEEVALRHAPDAAVLRDGDAVHLRQGDVAALAPPGHAVAGGEQAAIAALQVAAARIGLAPVRALIGNPRFAVTAP